MLRKPNTITGFDAGVAQEASRPGEWNPSLGYPRLHGGGTEATQRCRSPRASELASLTDEELIRLLPGPLRDEFRLSQAFIWLVELAGSAPPEEVSSMASSLKKGAAEETSEGRGELTAVLTTLAEVAENPGSDERQLVWRFRHLLRTYNELPLEQRSLLVDRVEAAVGIGQSVGH